MLGQTMIPVPGLEQDLLAPAECGSRLLDACDLEPDSLSSGMSLPSSASSAMISDMFIFDSEPLMSDWSMPHGVIQPVTPQAWVPAPVAHPLVHWQAAPIPVWPETSNSPSSAIHVRYPSCSSVTRLGEEAGLRSEGVPAVMSHTQSLPELRRFAGPTCWVHGPEELAAGGTCRGVHSPMSSPMSSHTSALPARTLDCGHDMGRSMSADRLLGGPGTPVGDAAPVVPHIDFLTPLHMRKGRGGRQPAADPRLDPRIDPKKARRILANRLSAAKSKLKQKNGGMPVAGDVADRIRRQLDEPIVSATGQDGGEFP